MRLIVAGVLAVLMLAGCADTPVETDSAPDEAQEPEVMEPMLLPGTLSISFDNLTVVAGMPFNVTLDYTGDNATNASSLAWVVTFSEVLAEAVETNATGNATGNATAADNETVSPAEPVAGNITVYEGTGLPAVFEANLTAGNFTVTGIATGENGTASFDPIDVMAIAAVLDAAPADPCMGAAVQETVTFSGTILAGVFPATSTNHHDLEVLPCQTGFLAQIDISGGGVDMDWEIFDPKGASKGSGGSSQTLAEDDIKVSGSPLAAGTWDVAVELWAGAEAEYTVTVTFA